jgi:hypothetical protein
VVSEEAPLIRTTLSLTSAIQRPVVILHTLQLIASRAAVQNKTLTGMCRHGSPIDGDGVMAWNEPATRKSGCGTAEMIAAKGGRGCVQELKEGVVSRCVGSKVCCSKPSHNTNCVDDRRSTRHIRAAWRDAQWTLAMPP